MKAIKLLAQMLVFAAVSAVAASEARAEFPLDWKFIVISINGERFGANSPTLTVTRDRTADELSGKGRVGCNTWTADIKISQNRFSVDSLFTTLKFCPNEGIRESRFLKALKAVKHWRVEGSMLILEGGLVSIKLSNQLSAFDLSGDILVLPKEWSLPTNRP